MHSDRLATVSATQALKAVQDDPDTYVSLGLEGLDALLCHGAGAGVSSGRGLALGQMAELIGPPGVGKTTIWLVFRRTLACFT